MNKKLTKEEFIEKARNVHGDKYDYSKVKYIDNKTEIIIICPIHGEFKQTPNKHLLGHGCINCIKNKRYTNESFKERAIEIHDNKYDYSKLDVNNRDEKGRVCIICPIHGEFWQKPEKHLQGKGCKECGRERIKIKLSSTKEEFIKRAIKIHGDKYDYSKVKYNNANSDVIITCKIHGDFKQTPSKHLLGQECPKCKNHNITNEIYIDRFRKIHGDKYDYSKVDVNNRDEKGRICIICPIHGEFWQKPSKHLQGRGCHECGLKKNKQEKEFIKLIGNDFDTILYQKHFDWLGLQKLDFYIPKYNTAIELQGKQHFKPIKYFGGEEKLNEQIERDWRKIKLCEQNGVKLFHFAFLKENIFKDCGYDVINNIEELIDKIKNGEEK